MIRSFSSLRVVVVVCAIALAVYLAISVFHVQDLLHDMMLSQQGHEMMESDDDMQEMRR